MTYMSRSAPRRLLAAMVVLAGIVVAVPAVEPADCPVVGVQVPVAGSTFVTGSPVHVLAYAVDGAPGAAVSRMEFFVGERRIGQDAAAPYLCSWQDAPVGDHHIRVEAVLRDGTRVVGASSTIQVCRPTTLGAERACGSRIEPRSLGVLQDGDGRRIALFGYGNDDRDAGCRVPDGGRHGRNTVGDRVDGQCGRFVPGGGAAFCVPFTEREITWRIDGREARCHRDDPPPCPVIGVGFVEATTSVREDAGTLTVTVRLTQPASSRITVGYTISGSATAGADHDTTAGTLTFERCASTATIRVPIRDDQEVEQAETVILTLHHPVGAVLGRTPSQTVTIIDNDTGGCDERLTVFGPVTVIRSTGCPQRQRFSFPAPCLDGGVRYRLVLVNGDAATDKPRATSVEVELNDREIWDHCDVKHGVARLERDVCLRAWNSIEVEVWGQPTSQVTLWVEAYDPRPLTVSFAHGASTASEAVVRPSIAVRLNRPPLRAIAIPLTLDAAGTATAGSDLQLASTIAFAAGQTLAQLPLTIIDDVVTEPSETAIAVLGSTPCVRLGCIARHVLTITDNDTGSVVPSVAFQVDQSRVDEMALTVPLTVVLSTPTTTAASVSYAVGGTAQAGSDHDLVAGTLQFPVGATTGTINVPIRADALYEGDETLVVTLSQATGATLGAIAVHTLTIADDDVVPTVAWHSSSSQVNEGGTVAVTLGLTHPSAVSIVVTVGLGGSATIPLDLDLPPAQVTIPAGATQAALTLRVRQDAIDEADESVVLTLSSVVGATIGTPVTHTVTIIDDDAQPTVAFSAAAASVAESGGSASAVVRLSAVSGLPVAVGYVVGGTAASGDTTLVAGSVLVPAGATELPLLIPVVDNQRLDGDRTVVVTLVDPDYATLGVPAQFVLTIHDDETRPTVAFATTATTVGEAAGSAAVVIHLDRAVAWPVQVTIATGAGTATIGSDTGAVPTVVTVPAGATTASLTIPLLDDPLDETDETVLLTITAAHDAVLGTPVGHIVTITDDDAAPTVSWSVATASIAEDGGTATLTVRLSSVSVVPVTIPITVTGTAGSADATLPTGSISIAAGALTADVAVPVQDDQIHEADETVIITLGQPVHATLGAPATTTLTILDNDPLPSVSFATEASQAAESVGQIAIAVQLDRAVAWPTSVQVRTSGSAVTPRDYAAVPATITIPAGVRGVTLPVMLVDNAMDEPDRTVVLTLSEPLDAVLGAVVQHTLTIQDDDQPPTVAFTQAAITVDEGVGTAVLTVRLSAASGHPVVVPFSVGGTAGADDATIGTTSVIVAPGTTTVDLPVTIIDDVRHEMDETMVVTLGAPTGATLGAPASATVTITDNDALPVVAFTVVASAVDEAAGTAAIAIEVHPAVAWPVTVAVMVEPSGSATPGTDVGTIPATITIPAGAVTAVCTVPITADGLDEDDETLVLRLANPVDAVLGTPVLHTLTIRDDDEPPAVAWLTAQATIDEGAGTVTATLVLSAVSGRTVLVPITVSGSADATDHGSIPTTVSIPAGSNQLPVSVAIVDDALPELDETVILTLGVPTAASRGEPAQHVVTIRDNDLPPVVRFAQATSEVTEHAGSVGIVVQLDRVVPWPVQVTLGSSGTAVIGSDVGPLPATLTIPANTLSAAIPVGIMDDATDGPDVMLVLTLSAPVGATLDAPSVHTVTIADDDATPSVAWTATTVTIDESAATAGITLRLSAPSAFVVTAPFTVSGTADATDHGLQPGIISIPAGSQDAFLVIPLIDDDVPESPETIVVTLGTPQHAVIGTPAVCTVTLSDQDQRPVVSWVQASSVTSESAAQAVISLELDRVVSYPVVVDLTYAGTASVGADYDAGPAQVTILAGSRRADLRIGLRQDEVVEAGETLIVTLQAARADLGVPAEHTLTIADDDVLPSLSFRVSASNVAESVGTVDVLVDLSAPAGTPVAVSWLVSGSATLGTDHQCAPDRLIIPAGARVATISVPVIDDAMHETTEQVVLTLTGPTGATLGALTSHTISIADADPVPVVAFALAASRTAEDAGAAAVAIRLDHASGVPVVVRLGASGSTADIDPIAPTLTIPAGQTTAQLIVGLRDNAIRDGDRDVTFELVSDRGAVAGTPTTHVLTIGDDDLLPAVSWAQATSTTVESAGTTTVSIRLDRASQTPVAVTLAVSGTATSGQDVGAISGSVVIPAGSVQATLTIAVIDDAIPEANETVVLTLVSADGALIAAPEALTLTIADDDTVGVVPLVEHVLNNGDGTWTAWFGYRNTIADRVGEPIGPRNHMDPVPDNQGQAVVFRRGRTELWPGCAFSSVFTAETLAWHLGGTTALADVTAPAPPSFPGRPIPSHVPIIRITSPTSGAVIIAGRAFTLHLEAYDVDGSVARVEVLVDGVVAAAINPQRGRAISLILPGLSAGTHQFSAVAVDDQGLSSVAAPIVVRAGTAPTVSLERVGSGPILAGGSVQVAATPVDGDGNLVRVEFSLDGTLLAQPTAAPWQATITGMQVGSQEVTATAIDADGFRASASLTLVATSAPQVQITYPASGQIVQPPEGGLPLQAEASDADGRIVSVSYRVAGVVIGTATSSPYRVLWTPGASGPATIVAEATDDAGITVASAPVTCTVNTPPAVAVLTPADGSVVPVATVLTVTATASDPDGGVPIVVLLHNGVRIQESRTGSVTATITSTAGDQVFTAEAIDAQGAYTLSAPVRVRVDAPPMVALTAPASGTVVNSGDAVVITADASDADGTVARVEFWVDGQFLAEVTTAPWTATWTASRSGFHLIEARAIDNALGASTATTGLVVNTPPVARWYQPTVDSIAAVNATQQLIVEAVDTDGAITSVVFHDGDTVLRTDVTSPFDAPWTPATPGIHHLIAVVTDDHGASVVMPLDVLVARPPVIALTAPSAGATVIAGSPLALAATASDPDGTVVRVVFAIDGRPVATLTQAPWSASWPNLAVGDHTITATAVDDLGLSVTDAVSISAVAMPQVALVLPVDGQVLPAGAPVVAEASVAIASGSIQSVEFLDGDTVCGSASAAPWRVNLTLVPGAHTLRARATSVGLQQTLSDPVHVRINGLPTVAIMAPVTGTIGTVGTVIPMRVEASDREGVARIDILHGDLLVAQTSQATSTLDVPVHTAGPADYIARVIDSDGAVAYSAALNIVGNLPPSCQLALADGASGYDPAAGLTLVATASDSDGTVAQVEFYDGDTLLGTIATSPYRFTWFGAEPQVHVLRAVALDNRAGRGASNTLSVSVNALPQVRITAPLTGSALAAPVSPTVLVEALDADDGIASVELRSGSTVIATREAPPWEFPLGQLASATYTLTAIAVDHGGQQATSTPVTFTVAGGPAVAITAPIAHAIHHAGEPVAIAVTATGPQPISRIEMRAGDLPIGTLTAAPWTVMWTPATAGHVQLTATAYDSLGLSATSLPIPLVINAVPTCDLAMTTSPVVTFDATAADQDGSVVQVEFRADDVLLATVSTAPYTWTWTTPPVGRHTITATAVDDRGARGVAPARILTISSGSSGQAPLVQVTSPQTGATVAPGATVGITAHATDSDGTVTQVEFLVGGGVIATVTVPPYATSWTPPGVGRFALTAIATDNAGNVATATPVDVLVGAPPQIALTSPMTQATFQPGVDLDLAAVTAGAAVRVEFLLDGVVVATDTASPWSARMPAPQLGPHLLTARAVDASNGASTSAAVPIMVTTPPTVALITPTAGADCILGEAVALTTTASDDSAVVQVVFSAGTDVVAGAQQAPWQAMWVPRELGSTVLVATATDDRGLTALSAPVAVRVVARPTCELEVSVDGSAFVLTATPTDADGVVRRVEFRVDDSVIATRTAAPWTTTWTPPTDGTFRLRAVAIDDADLAGSSPERIVASQGGSAPPSVVLTAPGDNARIDSGTSIVLSATADVVGSTITRVEFYDQTQLIGTALVAPWTFTWQPALGLHGVAAVAYAANGAVGVSPQARLLVDTKPTVTVTAPISGAVVLATQPVRLTAQATDDDDGIVQVVFRSGTEILGTVRHTPVRLDLTAGLPTGSHVITAEAMDTFGQTTTSAPVTITANHPPAVTVAAPTSIRAGSDLLLTANAHDADGTVSSVVFRVDGVDRVVDTVAPYTASVSNLTAGAHTVVAVATDNRGTTTASSPVSVMVNAPPVVSVSSPAGGTILRAGQVTTLVAQAADADGHVARVDFLVDGSVAGTATSAPWQVASWTALAGSHSITARATDDRGEVTTSAAVPILVQAPPLVAITAPSDGADIPLGSPITVTATAADVDGHVVAVRFYDGSALLGTATTAPWSIVWNDAAERTHDLTAVAVDNDGLMATTTSISVDVVGTNLAPTVALTAPLAGATAWSNVPLPLSATATDSDGSVIRVEWLSQGEVIATRTTAPWQAMWSAPRPGAQSIVARAIDDRGARSASAAVPITVRAATDRPVVELTAPAAGARLVAGRPVDVTATVMAPATVQSVTFTVNGVEIGSATSAPWQVAWTPASAGSAVVVATAVDVTGATGVSAPSSFQVVEAGIQIVITTPQSGATLVADRPTTIAAEIYDAVDIDRVEFFAGNERISTDTTGPTWTATWSPAAGMHTLTAVLYDRHPSAVADNGGGAPPPANFVLSIAQSAPVDVTAVVDSGAVPTVAFTYPATERAAIGLEPIRGTATTANGAAQIVTWELTWRTYDDGTPHRIATGSGAITNAVLGLFDSSLMRNGEYILDLTARDSLQRSATATRVVRVEGAAKPGQFGFSVQDLVVNVAGIPLAITRTYSTLNKDVRGDFGYGWTASFADMEVVVDETRITATSDDLTDLSIRAGNTGRDVTLTLPDGRRTTFLFDYSQSRFSADAVFRSEPGVTASLRVNPRSAGVLVNGLPLPAKPYWQGTQGWMLSPYEFYDLPGFILRLEDGTEFVIDRQDLGNHYASSPDGRTMVFHFYGKPYLSKIVSPDGQTITFSGGEIVSRTADGVVQAKMLIVRDAAGRIWKVYDPARQNDDGSAQDPASLIYHYNSNGDLIAVDKLASLDDPDHPVYETTTYGYEDAAHPHYLTSMHDPGQANPVRTEYDEEGRLVAIIDSEGHRTVLEHDLANRIERTTDRAGNTTITGYDARGNVVSITNAKGETVTFEYDSANRLRFRRDASGTTEYRYDSAGNMVTVIVPHPTGANVADYTTTYTYDSRRNVTSVRGPNGTQQFSDYNDQGMLLRVKDDAGNVIMERIYDGRGFMLSETTPFGTSQYGYDAKGNVTSMTDAVGAVTLFENDAMGRVTAMVSGGVRSTIQYDAQGREKFRDLGNGLTVNYQNGLAGQDWTQISCPTLGTIGRSFDGRGRLTGWTTANGAQPRFQYDNAGRLWRETDSLGRITEYHYDGAGRMDRVTDLSTGAAVHREYDGAGRVTAVVDALGNRTETHYAGDGGVESVKDARNFSWTFARGTDWSSVTDPLNRTTTVRTNGYGVPTTTEYPDGITESATYRFSTPDLEATDYPVTQTDAGDRTRSFGYSTLSQLVSATDRGGLATWRYAYNQGFLNRITDPLNQETTFGYDIQGRLSDVYAPGIGVRHTTWQLNGRPDVVTLPSGGSIGYTYDSSQRVTDQVSTDGSWTETAHFTWNFNDAPVTMTDRTGQTSYVYNAQGRLETITQPDGSIAAYGYDLLGRISVIEVRARANATAYRTEYRYLSTGQVERVIDPVGGVTLFTWDGAGRLSTRVLPNGITTTWGYDLRDRVTSVVHRSAANVVLASVSYHRLPGGEPDLVTYADGSTVELGYDGALRLTSEVHKANGGAVTKSISYAYDAAGNRTSVTRNGVQGMSALSPGDQLTDVDFPGTALDERYSYDAGGRTRTIVRGGRTLSLTYNARDQVEDIRAGGTLVQDPEYDAAGRRTALTTASGTKHYLVAPAFSTSLESPYLVANDSGDLQALYVYGPTGPLWRSTTAAGDGTRYYLEDGLGSVIALADDAGLVTATTRFDAFGNVLAGTAVSTGAAAQAAGDWSWKGMWMDSATGLYHVRARDLDPVTGRFLSRDPVRGDLKAPESFEPYAYAFGNPFVYGDPTGMMTVAEVTFTINFQQILNGAQAQGKMQARSWAADKVSDLVSEMAFKSLSAFVPGGDAIVTALNSAAAFGGRRGEGNVADTLLKLSLAVAVNQAGVGDNLYFEPSISRRTLAVENSGLQASSLAGKTVNVQPGQNFGSVVGGTTRPDFLFSGRNPMDISPSKPGWLIGDIKLSGETLYNIVVADGDPNGQISTMLGFARSRTVTRTALFLTVFSGNKQHHNAVRKKLIGRGFGSGVIVVVGSMFEGDY